MAYINKIQIKDNNGESLGNYSLYGLDEMVKVPYKLVTQHENGEQTTGNQTETNLRNAIFGSGEDADTLTNQILNGLVQGYDRTNGVRPGNLVTYIQHIHDSDFTSKKITALEKLSYGTIVDSPINIEWDTYNNKGEITVWSEKQEVSTHKITWTHTPKQELVFTLPQGFGVTGSNLTATNAAITFSAKSYANASSGWKWSLIPSSLTVCPVELGTDGDRFNILYAQTVKTNILDFQTTTNNSPIIITSDQFPNGAVTGRKKITTKFNVVDAESVQSTIDWGCREQIGQSTKILSMTVPNFFSIVAAPESSGAGVKNGIIFQSVESSPGNYCTQMYPEKNNTASLGRTSNKWGTGYFQNIDVGTGKIEALEVGTITGTKKFSTTGEITCGKIDASGYNSGSQSKFWDLDAHSIGVGDKIWNAQPLANGEIGCARLRAYDATNSLFTQTSIGSLSALNTIATGTLWSKSLYLYNDALNLNGGYTAGARIYVDRGYSGSYPDLDCVLVVQDLQTEKYYKILLTEYSPR